MRVASGLGFAAEVRPGLILLHSTALLHAIAARGTQQAVVLASRHAICDLCMM